MINIVSSILEIIILSSILVAAVLLIRLLFSKKLHTTIVSMLWILVLARLLIPFTINSPVEVAGLFQNNITENTAVSDEIIPQYITPEYNMDSQGDYEFGSVNTYYEFPQAETANTVEAPNAPELNSKSFNLFNSIQSVVATKRFWIAILTIWAIGAWLAFFINGYAIFEFNKKIKLCKNTDSNAAIISLKKAKQTVGINKEISVMECEFVDSPITCGIFNPKILLPKDFTGSIDSKKLYMIFIHELIHIKKHDIFKNYLWLIARVMYWFNPLVYLAYNRYTDDIEYICDETVLQCLHEHSTVEYAESLLDAVLISSQNTKIPVALPFCKSKSSLRKRIENMLKPQKKSKTLGMLTIVLCAVMVIACFTTACIGNDDINVIDSLDTVNTINEDDNSDVSLLNGDTNIAESLQIDEDGSLTEISVVPQPIKSNPVGSEESAVEIARNLNISKTENFSYNYYYSSNDIMPIHDIMVQSDSEFTTFRIYDCNGEISMIQTSVFMSKEIGEELPIEQLKQNVIDLAMEIYPNTQLDILTFIRDTSTWSTPKGDEIHSMDYIATGLLFDFEDNSTRIFEAKVRLDGGVRTISAEYSNMDYLMLSDDVRNKVLSYADNIDADIEIYQIDEYNGDYLLHFTLGQEKGYVTLLESDMSLVDICIVENEKGIPLEVSNTEAHVIAQEYADFYFPENEYITIKEDDVILENYVGEGSITFSYGTFTFYIVLDGDGKMHKMGIEPNVDSSESNTEKISKETARENAISELKMQCDFVEDSRITIISSEEYKDEYMETYLFNVAYTSDNPSIYNYSFSAQIHIDVYTGEYTRMHIEPILDGLDLLTKDEAIEKAKEYITEKFDLNADKLVFDFFDTIPFHVLEYQVAFTYPNGRSYGVSMLADTGELDGIGWGD